MAGSKTNLLRSLPYESCVGLKPVLCGWCPECQYVYDPYPGRGTPCDGEGERDTDIRHGHHHLYKRLMWRCPGNDTGMCEFYFSSYHGLLEHEHGSI